MDNKIHFKLITHEKIVFEQDIDELYVQSTDGKLGILKDHLPVICALNVGVTKIVTEGKARQIATMGGILQFENNRATILTDNAELDCDIDVARAKAAKERAEARLAEANAEIDTKRAEAALARALARLQASLNK